jgi:hypothetical protein
MNIEKTRKKLKTLSAKELDDLYALVQEELEDRPQYLSNTTHTPREQARGLGEFFGNAWIHG